MIEDIQPCGISSISDCVLEYIQKQTTTVDGWNPKQPPGMVLKPYK